MKTSRTDEIDPSTVQLVRKRTFSAEDRRILAAMRPLVNGLARFLGPHCEVLLHSLEDLAESVVQIENGHVTGRAVGSPVTDLALQILHSTEQKQQAGVEQDYRIYSSSTADGRPLRAVTMVVRNGEKPIGMVCVNFDLSISVYDVITMLSSNPTAGDSPEHYMMSAEELVTRSLDLTIQKATVQRGVSPQAKNRAIVAELNQQGIFDVKGAVEVVSAELGVSRFTVYNYLRDLRSDEETEGNEE